MAVINRNLINCDKTIEIFTFKGALNPGKLFCKITSKIGTNIFCYLQYLLSSFLKIMLTFCFIKTLKLNEINPLLHNVEKWPNIL